MSTDLVSEFEASAPDAVRVERTSVGSLESTLADHVREPAVGVPLPFEGLDLPVAGVEPLSAPAQLREAETGVTPAGTGIADYGTVTVESTAEGAELVGLYPRRHVVVLAESDLVPGVSSALDRAGDPDISDSRVLATGPSTTADMGALVEGVHGPAEVRILVVEGE